jgi:hypothetical protein
VFDNVQVPEETKRSLLDKRNKCREKVEAIISVNRDLRWQWFGIFFQVLIGIGFAVQIIINPNETTGQDPFLLLGLQATATVFLVAGMFAQFRHFRKNSKCICLYASVTAAEALDKGDIVKGSFYIPKLFEFLKPFSEGTKITFTPWKVSLKNALIGKIELLSNQRSAVSKVLLFQEEHVGEFSSKLYELANDIFANDEMDINKANSTLSFFIEKSNRYFEPATYLQKHKKASLAILIIKETLKITLVPILLFILWMVFGYKG